MPLLKPVHSVSQKRAELLRTRNVTRAGYSAKRNIVPVKERSSLLGFIRKQLTKQEFYKNWGTDGFGDRIKLIKFNGKGVLIKLVAEEKDSLSDHGKNPLQIRQSILAHQKAVRLGSIDTSKYFLVTPRFYGKLGHLVIMEQMPVAKKASELRGNEVKELIEAKKQLEENLWTLQKQGHLPQNEKGVSVMPQVSGVMYLGEMNGRKILALPYDIH